MRRSRRFLQLALLLGLLAGALGWAVSRVSIRDLGSIVSRLELWQIGLLLAINVLVVGSMAMRWWLILSAANPSVPLLPLVGYRLAAFAVSYFTFGPQLGGEPLQVILLQRRHGVSLARAASAVVLDKMLEFLGNIIVIGIGLVGALEMGMLPRSVGPGPLALPVLAILLACFLLYTVMLLSGGRPLSGTLRRGLAGFAGAKWFRLTLAAERLASTFVRRHPRAMLGAAGASLVAWIGMALEYLLMLEFLEIRTAIWPALSALAASLLAFLIPLPGGLGALEAGQVLALGALGFGPAEAIAVSLVIRARDLLNAGAGLWLLARGFFRTN
jgi:hypothetical protein